MFVCNFLNINSTQKFLAWKNIMAGAQPLYNLNWRYEKLAYYIFYKTLTIMSSQILSLLSNTLNPALLESTQRQIQRSRTSQGFATDLMIIADNTNNDIKIRQSALIVLKNMVQDQCTKGNVINSNDFAIIKGSILDALTRQWGNKMLTPTIREIIYFIAEIDYPDRWPQILPAILNNIATSGDFNVVSSSVQALKAITTVCGRSLAHEVTLSNLCNRMVIPLFELANKLFANYTFETQSILISIFKIFNLAIFYHLPIIFVNNIHSLMIFCKKILDLQVQGMAPLKIICLKILARIYSRHATQKVGYKLLKFAGEFHQKYSVPMVQSLVMQLMDSNSSTQIVNLSLNCLTSIYKYDEKSSELIDKYHQKLLEFCLMRYKMTKSLKQGQSIGSFITHLKEERSSLIDFITQLFKCNDKILGDLIDYLNKGDENVQQLVLYIFSSLSEQVEENPQLHQSMSQFIISYILPILSGNSSTLLKARGCEVIASYKYVQLPNENLQNIFSFIYGCLTQSKEPYLNIYALQAFTQLICKYDNFMKLIVPYLSDILKVYTSLLKQSNGEVYEVIKSFELFLGEINGKDIQNCAVDLIKFLTDLFYEYADPKNEVNNTKTDGQNQQSDQDSDDQQDDNPCNARQGCLACIRQIISAQNLPKQIYPIIINNCILQLAVYILSDNDLVHFEECLNILNMCLFKSDSLPSNFDQFFKIFAYSIVGIPNQLGSIVNLPEQYKQILTNVCVTPDEDIVTNVIGFFRNFIAKTRNQLRNFKDQIGISFMEYIFRIVEHVQTSKNDKGQYRFKKSERWVILTLYTCLLQYEFLQQNEIELIVNNLLNWYSSAQNQNQFETNCYIEVLLVSIYYNPEATLVKLNIQWFVEELLKRQNIFRYEYQLQRLILGIGKLMQKQLLKNQVTATPLIKSLPNLVFKLGSQRIKQDQNQPDKQQQNDIDAQQQAEQDLIAENTHMGFPHKNIQTEKQAELNKMEEEEWDEEYNKFYFSPYLSINQLTYLAAVLKNSAYTGILSNEQQERLSQYICNAPPKKMQN